MAKIKKVIITFDETDLTDVVGFKVFYDIAIINESSPFLTVSVIPAQTAYNLELPTAIPITDGTYNLGVVAVDNAGNESDMDVMTRFFDFTPPKKPVWRV